MNKFLLLLIAPLLFSGCKKEDNTKLTPRNDGYSYIDSTTKIFIPNAFTPNGDGINDDYGAWGIDYFNFQLTVKNIRGETFFTSTETIQTWDGQGAKYAAPQGYYIAFISFDNVSGRNISCTLLINLYRFRPGCLPEEAEGCKFGDMIDPYEGFIYPTTEIICN